MSRRKEKEIGLQNYSINIPTLGNYVRNVSIIRLHYKWKYALAILFFFFAFAFNLDLLYISFFTIQHYLKPQSFGEKSKQFKMR